MVVMRKLFFPLGLLQNSAEFKCMHLFYFLYTLDTYLTRKVPLWYNISSARGVQVKMAAEKKK